jgi:5-methylcytosine-specific restriction protein A
MPRANKICGRKTCGEIADNGNYCPEHTLTQNNWATSKRKTIPGWARLRQHTMHRDNNTCQVCGAPATEVDHIIPLSRGGTSRTNNLQAICTECNKQKNYRERRTPTN